MRRLITLAVMFLCALSAVAQLPPNVEEVETFRGITQYRLKSNGMTILLVPNHSSPVFTFMVVYHVGSRNGYSTLPADNLELANEDRSGPPRTWPHPR